MNIADFITELYCRIDDALPGMALHPQARLSISEVVTIGVLHAIKNVKQRPFYHWLKDNYGHLFPKLPERSGRDFHQAGRKGKSNHRWPRIGVRGTLLLGASSAS